MRSVLVIFTGHQMRQFRLLHTQVQENKDILDYGGEIINVAHSSTISSLYFTNLFEVTYFFNRKHYSCVRRHFIMAKSSMKFTYYFPDFISTS